MTDYAHDRSRLALPTSELYLLLLCGVLLGYALMGKGFAYLGVPPLYTGEIAFLAGVVISLRTGCMVASLASLPALLLIIAMVWVLLRTLPFVGVHGFDALRDSVVIMYGGFAFFVIALLLEDGRRIKTVIRYYGIMLASFPVMLVGFWLTKYWGDYIPRLYGPVPIVEVPASAVGTHLAGAMVFVLIGYRRVSPLWVVVWFATLALVSATNRGATLAVIIPVGFAMLMLGRFRLMLLTAVTAVCILTVLYVVEIHLRRIRRGRELDRTPRQRAPDYRECQEHRHGNLGSRQMGRNSGVSTGGRSSSTIPSMDPTSGPAEDSD